MPKSTNNIEVLSAMLMEVKQDVQEIKKTLNDRVVSQDQFQPIKLVVYGLVGAILLSVVGGVIALVMK